MRKNILFRPTQFWIQFSIIAALTVAVWSCNNAQKLEHNKERPNIIWINAEDISPAFGCYGDSNAHTPNIDGLAERGIVYENVYTTSPICSPSRSTFITGIHSTTLGTQNLRSKVRIPDDIKTLPTHLHNAGYFTTIYGKTDYNFSDEGIYDYWENDDAPWRKRASDSPFFSVFTFGYSHEGRGNHVEMYTKMKSMLNETLYHDSLSVSPPPYFPDVPEFQNLWTRYYDLVSLFDQRVGDVLTNLREDGLLENTIVFVFSDHGFGMPRYKRWLNDTGLRVPLVIYLPQKYRELLNSNERRNDEKISFVDLAPTSLSLADVDIPDIMQGRIFLQHDSLKEQEPEHIYATRDRADNMFEMSRAVRDDRYIYIRHFTPYQPYIQSGYIFSNEKESLALLRKYRSQGKLPPSGEVMFNLKPIEELYDLQSDPQELINLANDPNYKLVVQRKRSALRQAAIDTRDVGYFHEVEIQRLAEGTTPYEVGLGVDHFGEIFDAADLVGKGDQSQFLTLISNDKAEIRYWGLVGLRNLDQYPEVILNALNRVLEDVSPANQMIAAEMLLRSGTSQKSLDVLKKQLLSEKDINQLMAARVLELSGSKAFPLLPEIQDVLASYSAGETSGFKYIDYDYAAFISWSLEPIVAAYKQK